MGGLPGLWIISGSSGNVIAYSTNGTSYTNATSPYGGVSNFAACVAYGKNASGAGLWIVVGNSTNKIATSSNGNTWTGISTNVFTSTGRGVAFGKDGLGADLWVAVGQGGNSIAKSTDGGNTWSGVSTNGGMITGRYVTYANGIWVAVGEGAGNTLVTSSDGTNWTGFPPANNGNINIGSSVAYGNGRWIAVGSAGTSPRISYSDDNGISWTAGTSYGGLNQDIRDVKYANGIWVAVGYGTGGGVTGGIATSTDGITWTAVISNGFGSGGFGIGVAYGRDGLGAGLWVAVGVNGSFPLATSRNGTNWTGVNNYVIAAANQKVVFAQTN